MELFRKINKAEADIKLESYAGCNIEIEVSHKYDDDSVFEITLNRNDIEMLIEEKKKALSRWEEEFEHIDGMPAITKAGEEGEEDCLLER